MAAGAQAACFGKADLGVLVLHIEIFHNVAQQAGGKHIHFGNDIHNHILIAHQIIFLDGADDSGFDLFDQVIAGQAALFGQSSQRRKQFTGIHLGFVFHYFFLSHFSGFLLNICYQNRSSSSHSFT